ncbi:hypothetical protein V7654_21800 [Bacillus sp. JJ1609]|uniref:hypothetical protein n=1 Tax=Bacillus sp. JJ1609 TaxID=3122977 RepID=UPI002FFE3AB4
MKYQLYFSLFVYEKIDYWVPLMKYFLLQSDTIEIHCWNEENVIVEETKSMLKGSFDIISENNLTIFKGNKAPYVVDYLLWNNLDLEGKIKWFSIFLSKNATTIFHSEHWGMEFFAPNVNEKDIAFIKSVMPIDTNFNQYT